MGAKRNKRISITYPLIGVLLCGAVAGVALGAPARAAEPAQDQAQFWHVPELEAGFHLLYELKPMEAHVQSGETG
jgi:hypothetical protein